MRYVCIYMYIYLYVYGIYTSLCRSLSLHAGVVAVRGKPSLFVLGCGRNDVRHRSGAHAAACVHVCVCAQRCEPCSGANATMLCTAAA